MYLSKLLPKNYQGKTRVNPEPREGENRMLSDKDHSSNPSNKDFILNVSAMGSTSQSDNGYTALSI